MVGTAMLIDPIITECVSDPRMIDRLIAQGADGDTARGLCRHRLKGYSGS
jgi:hypothetical protein